MNFRNTDTAISLMGFVPALVVQYLMQNKNAARQLPDKQSFKSVIMFADVSGFTNLTETLSKIGHEGAELTAFAINRYMELLVSAISRSGGDIFKFAGDAIIVVWPPSMKENPEEQIEELRMTCRQALQSALDIQSKLDNTNILENIKLSVKIGFGIGDISIIYVGGVFGRSEYLATGDPLTQAFQSEHLATGGGQTIVSSEVYNMVKEYFLFKVIEDEHNHKEFYSVIKLHNQYKVRMKADAILIKNQISLIQFENIRQQVFMYIPAALVPYIEIDQEKWSSELRRISILFINLGIDLSDANTTQGLAHIQKVIETVQKCVYMHEGSLNKLLMDDKGSTLIVCFGLPPLMHQDDTTRAILTAFLLVEQLAFIKCKCKIGIATGIVFTGVVGTSGSRREYSVLGDSVNLAARLMQTAIVNQDGKDVLCCEETAKDSQQKIICKHWRDIQLKGKSGLVPVYQPIDLKEKRKTKTTDQLMEEFGVMFNLRTHYHSLPLKNQNQSIQLQKEESKVDVSKRKTLSQENAEMIGRQHEFESCQEILQIFLDNVDQQSHGRKSNQSDDEGDQDRTFILIKGTFGIGKSFLAKQVLKVIFQENEQIYKYGERVKIIISNLNPISKTLKMNGVRSILREAFLNIAFRSKRQPNRQLLEEIIKFNEENENQFMIMEEALGLREKNILEGFPPRPTQVDPDYQLLEKKTLGKMAVKIFKSFLEEDPKHINKQATNQFGDQNPQEQELDKSGSFEELYLENTVAPVIICLDDLQYYDELSFYIIKMLLKNFTKVTMLGLARDQQWDIPFTARNQKNPNRQQEEIFDNGLDGIDKLYNVTTQEFQLKGLVVSKQVNEVRKLLQHYFGIINFVEKNNEEDIKRESTMIYTRKQTYSGSKQNLAKLRTELTKFEQYKDPLLYWESKEDLYEIDFTIYVMNYIYLKTMGHPLVIINVMNNLIQQELIRILPNTQTAWLSWRFLEILSHDEWLRIDAPLLSIKTNSPVIDRLSCLEYLLLKFASVIGDIFDIQMLYKIIPFQEQINSERFIRILKDLDSKELIEFMDGNTQNQYYRFVNPFFREVLYQRMTFNQRRQIHRSTAQALQAIPQPFDYDGNKGQKRLEYHWATAETKVSIIPQDGMASKSQFSLFSNKAKRSIIVKQIQQILANSNYDLQASLKKGLLMKRSDKGIYWMQRFCVIDSRDFKIYENEEHSLHGEAVGILPLKQISQILPLQENVLNKKTHQIEYVLQITVSNWVKRSTEQASRIFIFSCESEELLEEWTIFLEFAKSKAIYNDFVQNFCKISFPINLTVDAYDTAMSMEITQQIRKMKISFVVSQDSQLRNIQRSQRHSVKSQTQLFRKQTLGLEQIQRSSFPTPQHKNSILLQKKITSQISGMNFGDEKQDFIILKERLKDFLNKSILFLFIHLTTHQEEPQGFQLGQTGKYVTKNIRFFDLKNSKKKSSLIISSQFQ